MCVTPFVAEIRRMTAMVRIGREYSMNEVSLLEYISYEYGAAVGT